MDNLHSFGLPDSSQRHNIQDFSLNHGNIRHDPARSVGHQHSTKINELSPHAGSVNIQEMQNALSSASVMDERGDNFFNSILNNPSGDMLVTNDNNFLLASMMAPPMNKSSFDVHKDSSSGSINTTPPNTNQINNSPVKKALNKVKQSPFKKRGNFEEEIALVTFPKSDSKDYCHNDLPRQLMGKMFGLLKEGLFCDSVILSGNTEIRVHRLVLLAACPFILSKMSDKSLEASLKIELPQGIPLDVTSQLVHYLYDGKVTLTSDNVAHFARVANLFKLTHLFDICKDFVIMFGIGQSILQDMGEDIIAIVKNDNTSKNPHMKETNLPAKGSFLVKISEPTKETNMSPKGCSVVKISESTKETTMSGKGFSVVKISDSAKKIVDDEPVAESSKPTPSHSYGTRRASVKTTEVSSSSIVQNKDIKPNSGLPSKTPPKHPIHTNAAFINSNRRKLFHERIDMPNKMVKRNNNEKSNVIVTETENHTTLFFGQTAGSSNFGSNIVQTGNSSSGQAGSNIPNVVPYIHVEKKNDNNDEIVENIDDLTDDCDEDADWKPHKTIKGRAITKKGRAAKAFKKSYATFLKTTKPKKVTVVPEQKEPYTLRPPPKKRAKFCRTEFDELEDVLSRPAENGIVHKFSIEDKYKAHEAPRKIKRVRRLLKASSYRAGQLSAVVQKLEQDAEHLPDNERHFICDICGNHYIFSKRAVTHIISVHDTELKDVLNVISIRKRQKVLKMCDICGYETKEPNFFYVHFHRYFRHGVPLPKGMHPFKCDICGKECFTKFQLKDHKLVHQEGTPFICELCGHVFTSRTCMTSHMFHKHSKIRNHKCTDYGCDKAFKTRTQLLVHMRSHTGEKPFQCPDCQYKSTTRGNMRLHLKNKHKHHSDIVKNIMLNLKPTQGDELLLDLEQENAQENKTLIAQAITQSESFTQNLTVKQLPPPMVYTHASTNTEDQQYEGEDYNNLIGSTQDQQILYEPGDPNNRPIAIHQFTQQQSLLLNNLSTDQIELLPGDQSLNTIQGSQGLVQADNLQHHIVLQDPRSTEQSQGRLADINGMTMQETRLLLQQHDSKMSSSHRQTDLQRSPVIPDMGGKSLSQIVDVQDIHPVYLHDNQTELLQQYERDHYNDTDEQTLLHSNSSLMHKNQSSCQGPVLIGSGESNQSHLSKLQITVQNRGQLEPSDVQGLVLSPSHNTSQGSHENRHSVEIQEESPSKGPTKMYLVDVNNISGVNIDTVQLSVDQGHLANTVTSGDSNSTLSQPYNDPQLLYQLYQQYTGNQNYQ